MPLFSKPDPVKKLTVDQAKEWKRELGREARKMEREALSLERMEKKVKIDIKAAAKRGDTVSAKMLAREMLQTRKAKERMYNARAQLNSASMQLSSHIATIKIAGAMAKSAEITKAMNDVISLPALNRTMMVMAREMEKAGLIEEMVDETLEFDDIDDMDELAQEEVDKVYLEVTAGILDKVGPAASTELPAPPEPEPEEVAQTSSAVDDDLAARIMAL